MVRRLISDFRVTMYIVFGLILVAICIVAQRPKSAVAANKPITCFFTDLGSATGSTYVYRSIRIAFNGDANDLGNVATGNCDLTGGPGGTLELHNTEVADQIWWGPHIPADGDNGPGGWTATNIPSGSPSDPSNCVAKTPTAPSTVSQCTNGTHGIFQDDAAAITFGSSMIYCMSMSEYSGCPGGDVYANGTEPKTTATRGAGFGSLNNPFNLTGLAGSYRSTKHVPITGYVKNTWSGNNQVVLVLSFRYKLIPPPPPLPVVTCTPLNMNDHELGEPYNVTAGFNVSSGTVSSAGGYAMSISYDGGAYGAASYSPNPATGSTTIGYLIPTLVPPIGSHSIRWRLTGPPGFATVDCDTSYKVFARPYFKVYGNDVRVGLRNGDASNCDGWIDNDNAGILGMWHQDGRGAGSQLSVTALGEVISFASAAMKTTVPAWHLTMANTDPPRAGSRFGAFDFGGNYGDIYCSKNFFSYRPNIPPVTDAAKNISDINLAETYIVPDGGTLTLTANAPMTGRKIIYVEGNVVLRNNFSYSSTDWASVNDIPYFYLVVRGNIYVDKGVNLLNGVYIAQPSDATSGNGKIYTCTNSSALYNHETIHANCNSQLKVYGTFIAQQIKFLRTLNTAYQAVAGQGPDAGGQQAPAEVIQFSPEIYLAPSPFDDGSGTVTTGNQNITSLPPVF